MRTIAVILLLTVATIALPQSPPPQFTLNSQALAKKIAERLDLQPGERFIALAHPGFHDDLIRYLRYEVMAAGAIDLGVLHVLQEPVPSAWNSDVLDGAGRQSRTELKKMLSNVDASVMLPGTNPAQPAYLAIQDLLREGRGRTIHFHWYEGMSAFSIPGVPLPARHVIEETYQRAVLGLDYEALAAHQRRFAEAMRAGEVRVTSKAGTDIRFRIGQRPINFQDGNAAASRTDEGVLLIDREIELPAGSIRVAPLEDSVTGKIVFDVSQWSGKPVRGLALDFDSGRIVSVTAAEGQDAVEAEIEAAGPAGRSFREFGLGFNSLLAVPEGHAWVPYYGYGAGIVRLSLGDNSELGGAVSGGYVRWNFFHDMTVTIDGDVWVDNGQLVR